MKRRNRWGKVEMEVIIEEDDYDGGYCNKSNEAFVPLQRVS